MQAYQDTFTKQQERSDRSSGAATGVDLAAHLLEQCLDMTDAKRVDDAKNTKCLECKRFRSKL